jgi:hypothetical protein
VGQRGIPPIKQVAVREWLRQAALFFGKARLGRLREGETICYTQAMRIRWLIAALVAALALVTLHVLALTNYWYWTYRWFDTPMHLLGGATIGLFAVSLLHTFRPFSFLALVILAFVLWEVFEATFGVTLVSPGASYFWDTTHDLLNDTIGATLVYTFARYTLWRSK